MATLRQLSEQILRLHYGGDLSVDNQIKRQEVDLLVVQAINARLKMERFSNLNAGSMFMDMPSAMIAQYIVPVPVDVTGPNLLVFKQNAWTRSTAGSWGNSISFVNKVITVAALSNVSLAAGAFSQYQQAAHLYGGKKYRLTYTMLSSLLSSSDGGFAECVFEVFKMNGSQEEVVYSEDVLGAAPNTQFSATIELPAAAVVYVRIRAFTDVSATYTGNIQVGEIALERVEFQNKINLPAQPIALPMNVGVWEVSDERYPDNLYIPMPTGSFGLTKGLSVSKLQGNIGFEVVGNQLHFKRDISHVQNLYIKLLVNDVNISRTDDVLPIPADMEAMIIQDVRTQLAPVVKKDLNQDNIDRP